MDGVEAIVPEYVANSGTRTEDEAVALCAQQCGDDYRYVGLQWSHECYCDNDLAVSGSKKQRLKESESDLSLAC